MSDMPREIDEKQLQEIFKRLSQQPQKTATDASPPGSKESGSSRHKKLRD
jgi:hypothetical protein